MAAWLASVIAFCTSAGHWSQCFLLNMITVGVKTW